MANLSIVKGLCKKPIKTPEKIMEIVEYFLKKDGGATERAANILQAGVNRFPLNEGLVHTQSIFSINPKQSIDNLTRLIEGSNTSNPYSYICRQELFTKLGDKQAALADLQTAYKLGQQQKYDASFLDDIKAGIEELTHSKVKGFKPIPLTKEQIAFNKQVENYWNKYSKEIQESFENTQHEMTRSNANTTMEKSTVKDKILASIKKVAPTDEFLKEGQVLYHGTKPNAKNSIYRQGFDINKCQRGEIGRGVYLGLDEQTIIKKYGDSVVKAKFTGDKVAQIEPGVYDVIQQTFSPVKFELATKLNIDITSNEGQKLLNSIISKYYKNLITSQGAQGLLVEGSYNAGCKYFAVLDPKYLQLI